MNLVSAWLDAWDNRDADASRSEAALDCGKLSSKRFIVSFSLQNVLIHSSTESKFSQYAKCAKRSRRREDSKAAGAICSRRLFTFRVL